MPLSFALDQEQKDFLGRQARTSIESRLYGHAEAVPAVPELPAGKRENNPLFRRLGSFVTLQLDGSLRGCIGTIVAHEPLYLNVWNMASAAAFEDPRFSPLRPGEWSRVDMEISVLDQPAPCPDPGAIVIGRDGLILQARGASGVFLPQVPLEQGWNLPTYLSMLCAKAGLPDGAWRWPDARLFWYQAQVFGV